MNTRTIIEPTRSTIALNHNHRFVALGSCFAQRMGDLLTKYKFRGSVNPYGTIFNPISITHLLTPISNDLDNAYQHFVKRDGIWLSYHHHSDIAADTPSALHDHIAHIQQQLMSNLAGAKVLMLTLGTSFVYEHKGTGQIVANCHKQPSELFERKLLSPDDSYTALESLATTALLLNPDLEIIITVSPVRHTRDTLVLNSRSKAHLLTAAHKLIDKYDQVSYFPAYELLMDDLRDYRYYTDDLIHPSPMAVSYVWDIFLQTYFSEGTRQVIGELDKVLNVLRHRPWNPESEQHQRFIDSSIAHATQLADKHGIDLSAEIIQLKQSSRKQ